LAVTGTLAQLEKIPRFATRQKGGKRHGPRPVLPILRTANGQKVATSHSTMQKINQNQGKI
jgi:hypothetical protein